MPRPELPIDRGWAWFVMLGAAINTSFGYGFLRSLSIFFPEFLDRFQESATMTTLAFGLNTAAFSTFAILVPVFFLPRYSARTVSLLGACLNAFSIIALAFAPSMAYVYVIFITIGAAGPMMFVSQVDMLGIYFKKRLSLAVAIANIGLCVATMGSPPLTRYLLDVYGLQGALLIQGGLNLHNIAAGLLFRPPSLYRTISNSYDSEGPCETTKCTEDNSESPIEKDIKNTEVILSKENDEREKGFEISPLLTPEEMKESKPIPIGHWGLPTRKSKKTKSLHDIHTLPTSFVMKTADSLHDMNRFECQLHNKRAVVGSDHSLSFHFRKRAMSHSSNASVSSIYMNGNGFICSVDNQQPQQDGEHDTRFESPYSTLAKKTSNNEEVKNSSVNSHCGSSLNSLHKFQLKNSVCCHPLGIMLLLVSGLGVNTQCATAYMPSLGKEQGLTDSQASLLMTVVGACDLCKLLYGYVADKGWIRRIYIVLGCQLVIGVMFQFASYFHGFVAMVILCSIFGANIEANHCLLPGITVDLLGAEFIGQVMSGYFLVNGINMSLTHLLVGYLKDETGSFLGGYYFIGGLYLLSVLVILLEPAFKACHSRYGDPKDDTDGP